MTNTASHTASVAQVRIVETGSAAGAAGTPIAAEAPADALEKPAAIAASRISRLTVAVGIISVIALVAALYLARAFFVPLLIGILASYALSPVVA